MQQIFHFNETTFLFAAQVEQVSHVA